MATKFEIKQCKLLVDFLNSTNFILSTPNVEYIVKYRKVLPHKQYSPDWLRRINVQICDVRFPRYNHGTKHFHNSQVRFHSEIVIARYLKHFGLKLIDKHFDIRVDKVHWKEN